MRLDHIHLIKKFLTENGGIFVCPQGTGHEERKILQYDQEKQTIVQVDPADSPDAKIRCYNHKTFLGIFRKVIEMGHG